MWSEGKCLPGGEGAGNAEEDDFLVSPLFAGVVGLGTTACGWVSVGDGSPSTMVVSDLGVVGGWSGGAGQRTRIGRLQAGSLRL
jgi:hypothetical protein